MNEYNKRRLNELPEIEPYFNDISQGLAERAYYATSHSPDRAASLIKSEYAVCLLNDLNRVKKIAERAKKRNVELAEDYPQVIDDWFIDHREGLKTRYESYLHSHSSVMSAMITGPANFPVARNEKRMNWAQAHYDNIGKFQKKSIKRIVRQLLPWGDGSAIASNDPKAIDKIKDKIEGLEKSKEMMKEINKITRRYYKKRTDKISNEKHTECVAELMAYSGYSSEKVELLLKPDWRGVVPFPSYALTNTGAEIRRLKGRLQSISCIQKMDIDDTFQCASVGISDKQQIAITFEGKPNEEIRSLLKSNGFKWSRYQTAWVRKMTPNAIGSYNNTIKPYLEALKSID